VQRKLIKIIAMEASFKSVEAFGKSLTIVHLSGRTEIESVALFKQACRGPLLGKDLLFNFQKLNFVGSMSLRSFLESLHFLATDLKTDVRFCCVSPDFRLVLDATPLRFRPSFTTEAQGVSSYEYEAPRMVVSSPLDAAGTRNENGPSVETPLVGDEYISLTDQGEEDFSVEG
jgi:anti-anti-sigma regulatory factor